MQFLLHEVFQHWHLERGLLRTFRDLTVRPGAMLRGYFEGRRRLYTGPLTYLLLAAAVSLVVSHVYADRLLQWSERFAQDMARLGGGSMPPRQLQATIQVTGWLVQHTAVTLLGGCVPFALLLRWLFRRTGVNLVEATVFSFYTWARVPASRR
jgi:hypothetical protein